MATKIMRTNITGRQLPVIAVFFEANKLFDLGMKVFTIDVPTETGSESVVAYSYDEENDDAVGTVMYMSIVHSGFNNMLDDFMIKCGFSPFMFSVSRDNIL